MAVENTAVFSGPYVGTGAVDQEFVVDFQSAGATQIAVYLEGVLVDSGDYVFDREADGTGVVTATLDGEVMIYSEPNFLQETEFQRQGPYYPDNLNAPLDVAAIRDLYLKHRVDTLITQEMLDGATRAGNVLGFHASTGAPILVAPGVTDADVLEASLAANDGFTLIKHKRAETGTFARTAAQMDYAGMLGAPGLSVMHFINPDLDVAIREGTITNDEDVAAEINSALNAALALNGQACLPGGKFPIGLTNAEGCIVLEDGAKLYAEPGAELVLDPDPLLAVVTGIILKGNNTLSGQGKLNGQALDEGTTVDDGYTGGAWLPNRQGIRAYATAEFGLGAENVTIDGWHFRNLRYMIQCQGVKRWRIQNCNFDRALLSAILMSCLDDQDINAIKVIGNYFYDCGDTGFAVNEDATNTTGQVANILAALNHGFRCNLITQGFFLDAEQTVTAGLYHSHVHFIGNQYNAERPDITAHGRGGIVAASVAHGSIAGNILNGNGVSSDYGIVGSHSKHLAIEGNSIDSFPAGAIDVDGAIAPKIIGNDIMNCGGEGSGGHVINLARAFDSFDATVEGNSIGYDHDYAFATAGFYAINATAATGKTIRGLAIVNNPKIRPLKGGIRVVGLSGTLVDDLVIGNNPISCFAATMTASIAGTTMTVTAVSDGLPMIGLELSGSGVTGGTTIVAPISIDEDGVGTWEVSDSQTVASTTITARNTAFQYELRYCNQPSMGRAHLFNAGGGFQVRNSTGGTLSDTELKGSYTMTNCDSFTDTTGFRIFNRKKYQTITNAVVNAGTGTIRQFDEVVPPVDAADDTAAAGAGVEIGSIYRTGSILKERIA